MFPAPGLALHPSFSSLSLPPSAGPLVARSALESAQRVCAFVCARVKCLCVRVCRDRERQGVWELRLYCQGLSE